MDPAVDFESYERDNGRDFEDYFLPCWMFFGEFKFILKLDAKDFFLDLCRFMDRPSKLFARSKTTKFHRCQNWRDRSTLSATTYPGASSDRKRACGCFDRAYSRLRRGILTTS